MGNPGNYTAYQLSLAESLLDGLTGTANGKPCTTADILRHSCPGTGQNKAEAGIQDPGKQSGKTRVV